MGEGLYEVMPQNGAPTCGFATSTLSPEGAGQGGTVSYAGNESDGFVFSLRNDQGELTDVSSEGITGFTIVGVCVDS